MNVALLLAICILGALCGFALATLLYRRKRNAQEQRILALTHDIEEALLLSLIHI